MWLRDSSSFWMTDFMSTPTSCPPRFTTFPATKTVSTFDVSAYVTMVAFGSSTGAVLITSVLSRTMSACLPGASDPTLSSSPIERAPSMVANSSTSVWVSVGANATSGVSVNSRIRSYASAVRIWVNISPGTLDTTSTLSEGRTPRASIFPVATT